MIHQRLTAVTDAADPSLYRAGYDLGLWLLVEVGG
jgi:hypothetical protein